VTSMDFSFQEAALVCGCQPGTCDCCRSFSRKPRRHFTARRATCCRCSASRTWPCQRAATWQSAYGSSLIAG
jgi:hypothetical protein